MLSWQTATIYIKYCKYPADKRHTVFSVLLSLYLKYYMLVSVCDCVCFSDASSSDMAMNGYLLGGLCGAGITGNLLTLVVLQRDNDKKNPTNQVLRPRPKTQRSRTRSQPSRTSIQSSRPKPRTQVSRPRSKTQRSRTSIQPST